MLITGQKHAPWRPCLGQYDPFKGLHSREVVNVLRGRIPKGIHGVLLNTPHHRAASVVAAAITDHGQDLGESTTEMIDCSDWAFRSACSTETSSFCDGAKPPTTERSATRPKGAQQTTSDLPSRSTKRWSLEVELSMRLQRSVVAAPIPESCVDTDRTMTNPECPLETLEPVHTKSQRVFCHGNHERLLRLGSSSANKTDASSVSRLIRSCP